MTGAPARWKHRLFVWVNRRFGYEIWNYKGGFPPDFDAEIVTTIRRVRRFTTTSAERLAALCQATEHVVRHGIPGDIVECGVWRGGSMMAVADTLRRLGDTLRHLYLFDTFTGMPEPGEQDVSFTGDDARVTWRKLARGDVNLWCYASRDEVRQNLDRTGYAPDRIHLVPGRVEDTVPGHAPPVIALLRLDTDWYRSVRHELRHLYPRLSRGGVLLIDDYGHWQGARAATDEYLKEHGIRLFLSRIDYTGRIGVKP